MGPEGGKNGGMIIAAGTPEEIAQTKSPTAAYIAKELDESGTSEETTRAYIELV